MTGLIKKNSLYFVLLLLLYCPGTWLYWNSTRTAIDAVMILMQASYILIIGPFSIYLSELAEHRYKGYRFLGMLPVTAREIVTAKMSLAFLAVSACSAFSLVMLEWFGSTPQMLGFGRGIILAGMLISLVLCGLIYAAIYRFGFNRVDKGIIALVIVSYVFPILAVEALLPAIGPDFIRVSRIGEPLPATLLAVAAVAAYAALCELACRMKASRPAA